MPVFCDCTLRAVVRAVPWPAGLIPNRVMLGPLGVCGFWGARVFGEELAFEATGYTPEQALRAVLEAYLKHVCPEACHATIHEHLRKRLTN